MVFPEGRGSHTDRDTYEEEIRQVTLLPAWGSQEQISSLRCLYPPSHLHSYFIVFIE